MRMFMRISIPIDKGNAAIKDGRIAKTLQEFGDRWHPEAMYFTATNGCRTAYAVVDLPKESDIPPMCEPLFLDLEAEIELGPAMNVEDLQVGLAALG